MRRWLGLIALGCFAIHATGCLLRGVPGDALWTCHMAVAALAVGLLSGSPRWAGIGCLWIIFGTPMWVLDVAFGAELIPTSLATHVGGFVVALLTVRAAGLEKGSWWAALLSGAALQQVCRWVTDPSRNINASFEVYDRFRPLVSSYAAYLLLLALIAGMLLWGGELLLRRLFPRSSATFWSSGRTS